VVSNELACSDIKYLVIKPEKFFAFKAGQHVEICWPGTNILRKYSIVSSENEKENLHFGVQIISGGELSPKLWKLKARDEIELRGPIGKSFTWNAENRPVVLIGAGSGMTTLVSIYNSFVEKYGKEKIIFIMSAKDSSRIMHYENWKNILVTRFTKQEGRINLEFLKEKIGAMFDDNLLYFICGPNSFNDDVVDFLLELGIKKENIKSERFI
jgi:ferredoxin-NADP reductase